MNAFVESRGFCVFAVAVSLLLLFCVPNAHKESVVCPPRAPPPPLPHPTPSFGVSFQYCFVYLNCSGVCPLPSIASSHVARVSLPLPNNIPAGASPAASPFHTLRRISVHFTGASPFPTLPRSRPKLKRVLMPTCTGTVSNRSAVSPTAPSQPTCAP